MNRIFRILVLLPLVAGCSGAFTTAIADPGPEASADDSGALKGDADPGIDAMDPPEGAAHDAAPPEAAQEAGAPEAAGKDADGCGPIEPSVATFTCPADSTTASVALPGFFALADGTQCSYQHTPLACQCAGMYSAACIAPIACAGGSPSGYTTSSGVVFVACQ